MSNLIFRAMTFARKVHAQQERKYTGEPYFIHLAEVAAIVASTLAVDEFGFEDAVATAWLHDTVEDCEVTLNEIENLFSYRVALGVSGLTDIETGANRAERKAKARERLAACSGWIQTIKCADLISNTSSIVKHDPTFATVYLEEKRLLLDAMDKADPRLREMAYRQCSVLPSWE